MQCIKAALIVSIRCSMASGGGGYGMERRDAREWTM